MKRSFRQNRKGSKSACPLSRKLKLLSITRSPKKDKKLRASFCKNGKIRNVDFGYPAMQNYGGSARYGERHLSNERKRRYIQRHKARENWNDPMSRGSLSRYILWETPSLRENIRKFKRKFRV